MINCERLFLTYLIKISKNGQSKSFFIKRSKLLSNITSKVNDYSFFNYWSSLVPILVAMELDYLSILNCLIRFSSFIFFLLWKAFVMVLSFSGRKIYGIVYHAFVVYRKRFLNVVPKKPALVSRNIGKLPNFWIHVTKTINNLLICRMDAGFVTCSLC